MTTTVAQLRAELTKVPDNLEIVSLQQNPSQLELSSDVVVAILRQTGHNWLYIGPSNVLDEFVVKPVVKAADKPVVLPVEVIEDIEK